MNSITYSHSPTRSVQDNMASLFAFLKRKLQPRMRDSLIMRMVVRALAVRPRGGIANDVLTLQKLSIGLHLEWLARDIHPWDRDLPEGSRAELFVRQCLEDVDAAIPRLFHRLPEVDVIEVAVVEPRTKCTIIAGIVNRADILTCPSLPLGMKLKCMGLNYHRSNTGFEPISTNLVPTT